MHAHPLSEDVWVKSSHSVSSYHLLQPSNAHTIKEHPRRWHTSKWGVGPSLLHSGTLMPLMGSNSIRRGQMPAGWLLAMSKQIYIAGLLPSPLSPPLQHLMLLLHFSSWVFPCFKRLLIFPWLLFNLMCVVFLLFSVTKFGEKAILDSFGWCTQPHTWHTGSCPTNGCYPGHLAQSRDCAA